jgi:hypothetical protein
VDNAPLEFGQKLREALDSMSGEIVHMRQRKASVTTGVFRWLRGRTRALLALAKVNCFARRLTNLLLSHLLNHLFKQKFDLFVQ